MPEKDSKYYDRNKDRAMLPLHESPWFEVYKKAAILLPNPEAVPNIIDLGCGSGRFAKLLQMMGYTKYLGVDFSGTLIKECRRYVPEFNFKVNNVFSNQIVKKFTEFDTFILLEILEHLEKDRDLVSLIPSGSNIIFSVPNYLSESHVRAFNTQREAIERYNDLIKITNKNVWQSKRPWDHFDKNGVKRSYYSKIFIFKGVKI